MKDLKQAFQVFAKRFMYLFLAINCISYTSFLTSSQPMMPGGMGMPMGPLPPLTEADIAELENLYQSLTANMSQEEKDALQKMGEELMTQYAGPQAPVAPRQEAPKVQQKPTLPPLRPESGERVEAIPSFPPMTPQQQQHIQNELELFIKNFSNLQTMIEASPDFATALRQWRQDINEILYSVKVINKPEHHLRLNVPEFARLLKTIEHINASFKHKAFSDACSQTEGCKSDLLDDPYATLHVSPAASQKEIDAAYKKLQKKFEATKKQTKLKGLTATEKEKALRSAQYSFDLATNAYDLIKDPKMRVILDKERQAKSAAERSMHQSIRQLLNVINQELGMAIYNNQLMNDLDNFLKKYEPAQLEARKKMEQAEAERLKELKEQEGRKPIGKVVHVAKDRGQAWDMPWYPQGGGYPNYPYGGGMGGGYHSNAPQGGLGGGLPGGQPGKPAPGTPEAGKPQTGGGLLKDGDKEPKTEAERKAAAAKIQKGIDVDQQREQLITDKTVMDIYDLDKNLKTFNDRFDRDYFETITASKPEAGKKSAAPQTVVLTPQTKKEVQEKLEALYEDSEPTPDEVLQKIESIKETIDDADDSLKKSYQAAWNNLQNRKSFEDNTKLLNIILETVTKDEQPRKPQGLTRGGSGEEQEISPTKKLFETIKTMNKHIKDLNEQFKTEEVEKKRTEKAKTETAKPFWQKTAKKKK